jgi:polyisoprenoid-binding protein YceI
VTKPVTLAATLNQSGDHPMAGKPWAGFDASATLVRSEFDLGMFAPYVSDEVQLQISIEAMKVDGTDS